MSKWLKIGGIAVLAQLLVFILWIMGALGTRQLILPGVELLNGGSLDVIWFLLFWTPPFLIVLCVAMIASLIARALIRGSLNAQD